MVALVNLRRWLVVGALLAACGCKSIKAPAPTISPKPIPELPASVVTVPVDAPLQILRDMAEGAVPQGDGEALYNASVGGGADQGGISYGWNVRRSPFNVSGQNNTISIATTLYFKAKGRTRIGGQGPLVYCQCGWDGEPEREAGVSLNAAVSVDKQWNLHSSTTLGPISIPDDKRCKICVVSYDLTDKIVPRLRDRLGSVAGKIDEKVASAVQFRPRAEVAWKRLCTPLKVGSWGYLSFNPHAAAVAPVSFANDKMSSAVSITARPVLSIGGEPPAQVTSLPDAGSSPSGDAFAVALPIDLNYAEASKQLSEKLNLATGGLRYPPTGRLYVKIRKVEVYGYGDQAVVRLELDGSVKGVAYLTGRPSYDALKNVLSFPDLEFTIETRNLIAKLANWIDHDAIRDDLRGRIRVDFSKQATIAEDDAAKAINGTYGPVRLEGTLANLTILGFYAEPKGQKFEAVLQAAGTLRAHIN